MFLYVPNFLSSGDRQFVLDELSRTETSPENHPLAPGRTMTRIQNGTMTHRIFTSPQVTEWFQKVFDRRLVPGHDKVPIEYRTYPKGSQGMEWHRDTPLVGNQYECVYTVKNTSDSQTLYKDFFGRVHPVWAEPGSLIVVQAGGVRHAVTPVTRGERSIVKFVLVDPRDRQPFF